MDPKEKEEIQEEDLRKEFSEDITGEETKNEQATEPGEEETLAEKIDELTNLVEEQKDKYLRLSAEFDNYRKRTIKEKAELILNGSEKSIVSFLPIVDDLERAISTSAKTDDAEAIRAGIEIIYNKFLSILAQHGVKIIETKEQPLNTDYHDAIAIIPAPSKELKGKILDTVQTGYTMNDKVIRHAKVVVGE